VTNHKGERQGHSGVADKAMAFVPSRSPFMTAHQHGRKEFSPAVRRAAKRRARFRCEECGATEQLELHHRWRSDPSLNSAQVLCHECHKKLHPSPRKNPKGRSPRRRQYSRGWLREQQRQSRRGGCRHQHAQNSARFLI
jgi:hypothetical protein